LLFLKSISTDTAVAEFVSEEGVIAEASSWADVGEVGDDVGGQVVAGTVDLP